MRQKFSCLSQFIFFIGPETKKYLIYSFFVGFLWFAVETTFVYVFQAFAFKMGLFNGGGSDNALLSYNISIEKICLLFIIVGIFRAVSQVLRIHISNCANQAFVKFQRSQFIELFFKNASKVNLKDAISSFSDLVVNLGTTFYYSSQFINTVIAGAFFFLYGLYIAPREMIIGVGSLSIVVIPIKLLSKRIHKEGEGIVREWGGINERIVNSIKNHLLLKIYGMIDTEIKQGRESLSRYELHYKNYSLASSLTSGIPLVVGSVVICLIMYVSTNYFKTSPTSLIAFFYIFIRLAQAASEGSAIYSNIKLNASGFVLLKKYHDLMENLTQDNSASSSQEGLSKIASVEAKDLSFSYDKKNPVLQNKNFDLRQGDCLVIRGESGSGKSTLLSIILGIVKQDSGEMKINGKEIQEVLAGYFQKISYVGPSPFLIPGTLRENLTYGHPNPAQITAEDISVALKRSALTELLSKLPLGLETPVNDQAQLSTGQLQRISIARAFLRNGDVFVMDEATANIDIYTEQKILSSLQETKKDKILIIVTHKESFNNLATKIITL